jgi:hypothetical protein
MEECEVTKLVAEVDMKTKEQKKSRFVKTGGMCICRIGVEKPMCIETFQVRLQIACLPQCFAAAFDWEASYAVWGSKNVWKTTHAWSMPVQYQITTLHHPGSPGIRLWVECCDLA